MSDAPVDPRWPKILSLSVHEFRTPMTVVAGYIRNREDGLALSAMLKQPIHDDVLVQNLSFALDFTPLEKQFLLESESLLQQGRRLLDLLQFKIHEGHEQTGWG